MARVSPAPSGEQRAIDCLDTASAKAGWQKRPSPRLLQRRPSPRWDADQRVSSFNESQAIVAAEIIRGGSVVGMAVVFTLLLRDVDVGHLLPWVNVVTHYIMPVAALLDWLFDPPHFKLAASHIVYWLLSPLCYVTYSLIRGATVGFYAYPFFNPAKVSGYGGVVVYCLAILIVFLTVGGGLLVVANRLRAEHA